MYYSDIIYFLKIFSHRVIKLGAEWRHLEFLINTNNMNFIKNYSMIKKKTVRVQSCLWFCIFFFLPIFFTEECFKNINKHQIDCFGNIKLLAWGYTEVLQGGTIWMPQVIQKWFRVVQSQYLRLYRSASEFRVVQSEYLRLYRSASGWYNLNAWGYTEVLQGGTIWMPQVIQKCFRVVQSEYPWVDM